MTHMAFLYDIQIAVLMVFFVFLLVLYLILCPFSSDAIDNSRIMWDFSVDEPAESSGTVKRKSSSSSDSSPASSEVGGVI